MPSTVVMNKRSDDSNWKIYPFVIFAGLGKEPKPNCNQLNSWEILYQWPGYQSQTTKTLFSVQAVKKENRFWIWHFHIRNRTVSTFRTFVSVALVTVRPRMCFLALGWRWRRAIHIEATCSEMGLAVMEADTWSASVAHFLKRNIVYTVDEASEKLVNIARSSCRHSSTETGSCCRLGQWCPVGLCVKTEMS